MDGYSPQSAQQVPGASQQQSSFEAHLRAMLNVIPAYAWYAAPSGALTFVNERTADYLGLPKDHPFRFGIDIGAEWDAHIALLHPDDHEETRAVWSTCLRTGSGGEVSFRLRNPEGGYRWFLSRAEPLRGSDGTLLYWVGVNLDIDTAKRAEQDLRDAMDTIPAIVWSALPDGSNTYINKRLVEYSGMSAAQMCESGWKAIVHPDDLQRHKGKRRASMATGQPYENEVRFRRADGLYRWHLDRGVPLRDEAGSIVKWYGVVTDIEDRKRAEEQRERLHQLEADLGHVNRVNMLGELAASLAHEIKQPITAAITSANACLRWLERDPPDLERARAAARRVGRDGNRASDVINRLRSFYKKGTPQRELVDVTKIIEEMIVLLSHEADRRSISIRSELGPDTPKILADGIQLQQVFMNLMLNGIEAMEGLGGELTIKTQLLDGELLFSVSDTGVGLPAENMDQIFSAFFTTKAQGSGMGLAISRSIVESHGGRLWAAANDGPGASFQFTLPIQVSESSPLVT